MTVPTSPWAHRSVWPDLLRRGFLLVSAATLVAQQSPVPRQWNFVPRHLPGAIGVTTWDEHRQRVVLLERTDTWEWDGSAWFMRTPQAVSASPDLMSAGLPALAYDAARRQVVAFGQSRRGEPQTWVWDGVAWQRRYPANTPTARSGHGMAYDAARQLVVLAGGWPRSVETWTWNGTDWSPRRTPTAHNLISCSIAYDAARQRVVAVGPRNGSGTTDAVWEWDGVDWSDRTTLPYPGVARGALAYDPMTRRCVYYEGESGTIGSWDGTSWDLSERPRWPVHFPRDYPMPRLVSALAYDGVSGKMLMVGGNNVYRFAETWHWRGTWQLAQSAAPPARFGEVSAYHAATGDIILFGGTDGVRERVTGDCWAFDGWRWRELKPNRLPEPRGGHAMVYDAARRQTVMFGGGNGRSLAPSTWLYSDGIWRENTGDAEPRRAWLSRDGI